MEKTMTNKEKLCMVMNALDAIPVQSKQYVLTMAGAMQVLSDVIQNLPDDIPADKAGK